MYSGFPSVQVALLRCPYDQGTLALAGPQAQENITDGTLRCSSCDRPYPVSGGIVRLLDEETLDAESAHERRLRDQNVDQELALSIAAPDGHALEMRPTLAALRLNSGCTLLELGCGVGRYTTALAARCVSLLAVDFSFAALRILAQRLSPPTLVGLVQADVTRLAVAPQRFQRCLSTLASNLPAREHRQAMYKLAAAALADEGRFVFSVHHHHLRSRRRNVPQAGRYSEGGIYRYCFTREEVVRETRPSFDAVRARPIVVELPFTRRLGLHGGALSRLAERVPGVNELGGLLLVEAERPVRSTAGRVEAGCNRSAP